VRIHVAGRAVDGNERGAHPACVADDLAVVLGVSAVIDAHVAAFEDVADGVGGRLQAEQVPGVHRTYRQVTDGGDISPGDGGGAGGIDTAGDDLVHGHRRAGEAHLQVGGGRAR